MAEERKVSEFLNWLDRQLAAIVLIREQRHRSEAIQALIDAAREQLVGFSEEDKAKIRSELKDWAVSAQLQEDIDQQDTGTQDWSRDVLDAIINSLA